MLTLTATHTLSAEELVVRLDIHNPTGEPAYVPVLPADAEFEPYPHSAYAHLSHDGTTLHLLLGPSYPPVETDVEVLATAFHSLLPPRSTLQHELRFALPVREWYGYYVPPPDAPTTDETTVYAVHMTVLPVRRSRASAVAPAPSVPDHFLVTAKGADILQATIVLDRPIPVVRCPYPDFPRM